MVSNKRLRYTGFNGFHAPVVPKAPRSIRKNIHKKSSSGNEICPFELLAAVAGKLLQESEGSASSTSPQHKEQISILEHNVKQEQLEDKVKPVRSEDLDHGCCAESQFIPEPPSNLDLKPLKDLPQIQSDNDSGLEHASVVTTSSFLKEVSTNVKLEASDSKNGVIGTPTHGDLCDTNMPELQTELIEKESEELQDTMKRDVNGVVLNKSYSSVHVPFYRNVKIGIRDDDENCFSYNHNSNKMKAFRFQSRRRIRKMLTSKYWKTAPKLKDYELPNITSGGVRPFNYNKKSMYKRESCQRDGFFRKRKLFHQSSKPDYIQDTSSESISNSPERSDIEDKMHPSKRVKFSIKSFKVPELYLEMPETSTVGSLKRTVMEALTAILGGELHIGVLLEGKKVRDDNITLEQTGISLNSDTLGFMLEPNLPEPSEKPPPMSPELDNPQPPLPMSPGDLFTDVGLSNASSLENQVEKTNEEIVVDTKAIVPIAIVNPEALAVVPPDNKPNKRSELSQRRTRRPFSVSEVEALVEAVETLGTGRWRDVKIRAFDDANHRTYVDLKDKWKTLVHTASIAPQQRRGEPVPQDLLDRVLAAHGFWTQHQSKQNGKSMTEPIQTLGTPVKV